MFAQLLRAEVAYDSFCYVAAAYFQRRQRHYNMLQISVARLIHLRVEALQNWVRGLPGAKLLVSCSARHLHAHQQAAPNNDCGNQTHGVRAKSNPSIDALTFTTYIQQRHQNDIEELCSTLARVLNGDL